MYEYRAKVRFIHDGDTIRADIDLGFGVWRMNEAFRLIGIQAPEIGKPGGRESRDWLRDQLPLGTEVTLHTIKDAQEKYGRYLASVFLKDLCLNDALIDSGHAVAWDGTGPRP